MKPDGLAAAEEGQSVQGFAEAGEGLERIGGVGGLRVNDLVIHAAEFGGPLLEELAGALLDREVVITVD